MNTVQYITIQPDQAGQRVDNFLIKQLKGVPKSLIYRMIRKGEIRINKSRIKAHRRLSTGDQIRLPPIRTAQEKRLAPHPDQIQAISNWILYEDNDLLVLNKPAGLAVHGGSGLSYGLIELIRFARPKEKLELVHRLDRETSGCLMIAKRRSLLKQLHQLQMQHQIDKKYIAVLAGRWHTQSKQVHAALQKNHLKSGVRMVRVDPKGQAARTDFKVIKQHHQTTLVEARLHTGRTHQIRVHARYLNSPILGDQKYGNEYSLKLSQRLGVKRLLLHASELKFRCAVLNRYYHFQAPWPADFEIN